MNNSSQSLSPLQRAALALQEMRCRIETLEGAQAEPIAIVSMGCRFPGGIADPESYWEFLRCGRNAVGEIPEARRQILASLEPGCPQRGGFLERVDEFDAEFFDISPRAAATLDPQQRLFLEVCWEALEGGGIAPSTLVGSDTGVFLGIGPNEFLKFSLFGDHSAIDTYTATGNASSVAAGRIAYWLGLQGPAMAIDTACSSSLVAVHLACQSLRSRECSLALAGGVYLMLASETTQAMAKLNALSADGYCKTFDAAADGYGRGEGCGAIVLKRLGDALTDGDRILATIRGSAVNHDGRSSGLTVPNGTAQQAAIRAALNNARVQPEDIQYVEAHGTGTPLGDPIEVGALGAVFAEGRSSSQPLAIGSVKTNIGHLEAAAGLAGLMKVVLALQHQQIPPHLHLQQLNDRIDLCDGKLTIPTQLTPWPTNGSGTRMAGISAFGFSGTNAHAILESASERQTSPPPRSHQILCLSAKSERALQQQVEAMANYLRDRPQLELAEICTTANVGRSHFSHRLALLPSTRAELQQMLDARNAGNLLPECWGARSRVDGVLRMPPKVAFYFPPVAPLPLAVGGALYKADRRFQAAIDAGANALEARAASLLVPILQGQVVPETEVRQWQEWITLCRQVALARLWQGWGIEPTIVVGEGRGERAAACLSDDGSWGDLLAETAGVLPDVARPMVSDAAIAAIQAAGCDAAIAMGACSIPASTDLLWLPSLDPARADWEVLLAIASQLYVRGADFNWAAVEEGQKRSPISLPTYPFQRQAYTISSLKGDPEGIRFAARNLPRPACSERLLGRRLASPLSAIQFEADWDLDDLPLVRDHRLQERPIANLVVYLEMLQAGAMAVWGRAIGRWTALRVPQALAFDSTRSHRVQLIMAPQPAERCEFQIFSPASGDELPDRWLLHFAGEFQFAAASELPDCFLPDIERLQGELSDCWDAATFYQHLEARGVALGTSCQVLESVWRRDGEALGRIASSRLTMGSTYHLPLQELDAAFQLVAACLPLDCTDAWVIFSLQQLECVSRDRNFPLVWAYAKIHAPVFEESRSADIMLFDSRGQCALKATQLSLRPWKSTTSHTPDSAPQLLASRFEEFSPQRQDVLERSQLLKMSVSEQIKAIEHYLISSLAGLLQIPENKIQKDRYLAEWVDSLMALELQNKIETDFKVRLTIDTFIGQATVSQLANTLLERHTFLSLLDKSSSQDSSEPALEIETETFIF